ncbi:G2-specific serine/threonine protein kinase [Kalmusia sp. IMI 367209]|nr:G2-specific serine/threonine protein kinase [Kalmusia sp. IMI 367209]
MMVPPPNQRFENMGSISNSGENNAGIFLEWDAHSREYCIEKRLKARDVRNGYAQREIELLIQLQGHPNIANLVAYDYNYPEFGRPSAKIWTHYCDHRSLDNVIEALKVSKTRAPEAFLWHVFEGLAEAVRHCQQGPQGYDGPWNTVYHRDIKPSNVFLASTQTENEFPRVVLGDFGCSTSTYHVRNGFNDEQFCSIQDLNFVPPEAPKYTLRSDIYQIGIVLYCLMFAQLEPCSEWNVMLSDILHQDVWLRELRSDRPYSLALVRLVSKCLTRKVDQRLGIGELTQRIVSRARECSASDVLFDNY